MILLKFELYQVLEKTKSKQILLEIEEIDYSTFS